MEAPVFNQLVENLKRDGCLTQLPTIYQDEVLSGNHRVQAAIKAGIVEDDCIEILGQLADGDRVEMVGKERRVGIQLSHNAISGKDDPNLLARLYEALPLEERLYSGITDDQLKPPDPLDLASLSAGSTVFETIELVFLPDDAKVFVEFMEAFGKRGGQKAKGLVMLASLSDFTRLFDTIVETKGHTNIHNTALAVRMMAELAHIQISELRDAAAEAAAEEVAQKEPAA